MQVDYNEILYVFPVSEIGVGMGLDGTMGRGFAWRKRPLKGNKDELEP